MGEKHQAGAKQTDTGEKTGTAAPSETSTLEAAQGAYPIWVSIMALSALAALIPGAILFGKALGWQDHIGHPGGFGKKDILNQQKIEVI